MKKLVMAIALMALGTTVSFAQSAPATEKTIYECPMHCEPATDHAGTCGKCKMDLVEVKPKAKAKKQ